MTSPLQNLPKEVLEDIFLLCERPDLLKLTLVCKSFNQIISNSTNLMKMVHIDINRSHSDDAKWNGTRKYSQLYVHKMHSEFPKIIESIHDDLALLRLVSIKMDANDLKNVLLKSPKLKSLALIGTEFALTDITFEEPLPVLELDSLACSCNRLILRMLIHCQAKKFSTYRVRADEHEMESMQMYLKNQKRLDQLMMHSFHWDWEIFNNDALHKVDFRLKQIHIQDILPMEIENFIVFIKNHRFSLEKFDLCLLTRRFRDIDFYHLQIMNCIADFPNLKELTLRQVQGDFKPLPYVEKLLISGMGYGEQRNWGDKFPNLKHLTIQQCNNPAEISKLKKLETLHISGFENFVKINLPQTVKTIEFYHSWMKDDQHPFDFENHQIENFTAEECIGADWVGDFLRCLKNKLKFLKIHHTFLNRNRRFNRLFEKEPELKNKAEKFIFVDYKDDLDEDTEPSDMEEEEEYNEDCYGRGGKKLRLNPITFDVESDSD